jgi:A/G-specific adenine glycosylase
MNDLALTPALAEAFASQLIDWYGHNARTLPWRTTHDPYAIWVSEVMLQQTQVATVLPYYHRWIQALPTLASLAAVDDATLMKLWEGLGYYNRGRRLKQAAQHIVQHHGGRFPTQFEDVLALPGIGRSTAGAILTFAYGQAHPIADGNVKRVLARVLDLPLCTDAPVGDAAIWQASSTLVEATTDAYHLNQALMELGATCCTRHNPTCLLCPVAQHCQALANGTVAQRPVRKAKAPTPHKHISVGVLFNEAGHVLIQQRPDTGLLPNLWEFPGGKQEEGETLEQALTREWLEELNLHVTATEPLCIVKHAYTHFKVTLHVFICQLQGELASLRLNAAQAYRWATLTECESLAFPKANHAILTTLKQRQAAAQAVSLLEDSPCLT